jgi:hypothetical protein
MPPVLLLESPLLPLHYPSATSTGFPTHIVYGTNSYATDCGRFLISKEWSHSLWKYLGWRISSIYPYWQHWLDTDVELSDIIFLKRRAALEALSLHLLAKEKPSLLY